jgi:Uma2 family endonuclease
MSEPYEELLDGETILRLPPGARHEAVCARLHELINASVANIKSTRLLPPRTRVEISPDHAVCPDLALITAATGKLWLAVEIIDSDDHRVDTVVKKQIYEDLRVPRLWIFDPRYDNLEVYHCNEYGLALKGIMAGREILTEELLPEFQVTIAELFR